jgi:hypothetical protein
MVHGWLIAADVIFFCGGWLALLCNDGVVVVHKSNFALTML